MTARRAPDWLTGWEYAHRGLHGAGVPENSLAAAQGAIAAGMGIECDIQMSADGVPMVFHDWDLARLTEAQGLVVGRSAAELEQLHLLGTDQGPFRLAALLDLVAGRVPLLIEVKSMPGYDVTLACAAVAQELAGYTGALAVMSFDPRVGGWFFKHDPGLVRGLVGTDTLDHGFRSAWRAPGALEQAQPDFLAVDIRDLPNAITDLWRADRCPLLSWTIRSPHLRERALDCVDALIAEGEGLA
ncbi:MAG: glycerophosphodiester phosphodiesterase [Porphyrobacter sp. IPPAS B-1204]|nr:MAG: glycerophosphodiester phosphodiesterase [Porphyrobacter sp. IPPAS B-1204]